MAKILVLSDSFNGYGAEKMLLWVGNYLVSINHEVIFCAMLDKERNQKIDKSSLFYTVGLENRSYGLRYYWRGIKKILGLYRTLHFDYILTFHTNPFLLALISKLLCKYKLIHSERDNPYNRNTILSRMKMQQYCNANKIVFQTEGARDFFSDRVRRKSVIIPNPIELPFEQWDPNLAKNTIACVGRLNTRYKRQDLLISAFARVAQRNTNYNLVFYGDGEDLNKLKLLVNKLGVEDKVIFAGKVDKILDQIINDGIFVLCSDSEGMPNALMEAMSLGMPVLSTDCEPGGARCLIENDKNGLLVPKNDEESLYRAICSMLDDKEMQLRLGINARESMKKYSPLLIGELWGKLFNE